MADEPTTAIDRVLKLIGDALTQATDLVDIWTYIDPDGGDSGLKAIGLTTVDGEEVFIDVSEE